MLTHFYDDRQSMYVILKQKMVAYLSWILYNII